MCEYEGGVQPRGPGGFWVKGDGVLGLVTLDTSLPLLEPRFPCLWNGGS